MSERANRHPRRRQAPEPEIPETGLGKLERSELATFHRAVPEGLRAAAVANSLVGHKGIFASRLFGDDELQEWTAIYQSIIEAGKLTNFIDTMQAEMAAIYAVRWRRAVQAEELKAAELLHNAIRNILDDLLATKKGREHDPGLRAQETPAEVMRQFVERARERMAENAKTIADNTGDEVQSSSVDVAS
jgi:hypothetical protein